MAARRTASSITAISAALTTASAALAQRPPTDTDHAAHPTTDQHAAQPRPQPTFTQRVADAFSFQLIDITTIPPDIDGIDHRVGGLSGLAAEPTFAEWPAHRPKNHHSFFVVSDDQKRTRFYRLDIGLTREADDAPIRLGWSMSESARHAVLSVASRDAEAIALPWWLHGSAIVAFESPPSFGFAGDVGIFSIERAPWPAIPERLAAAARPNRGPESLAVYTPAYAVTQGRAPRRAAVTAFESSLTIDGPEASPAAGALCRVLRWSSPSSTNDALDQLLYLTDRAPSAVLPGSTIHGLVELTPTPLLRLATPANVALSERNHVALLFALERSFSVPRGYDASIFLITGESSSTETTASGETLPLLDKAELLDLRHILPKDAPGLGNLEGMAFGPPIASLTGDPDEPGYLLLLVADDNFGRDIQRGSQLIALRATIDLPTLQAPYQDEHR